MKKIKWLTMPIPKEGSTFAFKANIKVYEFFEIMQNKPELDYDVYTEYSDKIVYLIGHKNATDHIATYVPSTDTLFTSTREVFR